MAAIEHIGDQFAETVEPRFLEQYKGSERWQACLKAVIDQIQTAEDAGIELSRVIEFKDVPPAGAHLDWIASLVNFKRFNGESDEQFYRRFVSSRGKYRAGTPNGVIASASEMSGDPRPRYFDESPATFFVYTPEGRQLKRAEVQKMAMTGVLGLPGAAIRLGNGKHWRGVDGKKILCVAQDTRRYVTAFVVDEQGRFAVTEEDPVTHVSMRVIAVIE